MKRFSFLMFSMILLTVVSAFGKIDDSVDIFFPKNLKYLQFSQSEFKFFWWNFVVIDPSSGKPSFEIAEKICSELLAVDREHLRRVVCNDDLSTLTGALGQWAGDLSLREVYSADKFTAGLETALGEIAMMSSGKSGIFELKRADPLDQWQIFLERSQANTPQTFERQHGFLVEPKSLRIVIPIQFTLEPKKKNAESVVAILEKYPPAHLVGAHSSASSNETQVDLDLKVVSVVGLVTMLLFVGLLVWRGCLGALLLLPPLSLAMLLAAALTHWIYGSIHGLTLAFGTAIVGLGLDYGLHGAFNSQSKQIWKSNFIGLTTTLAGLGVMLGSSVPLLRQMMVFAVCGIIFCFVIFYFVCRWSPELFSFPSLGIGLPEVRWGFPLVIGLALTGLVGSQALTFDFDLRRFNYQTKEDAEATQWFFTAGPQRENILLIHDQGELAKALSEEAQWAAENKIAYVGLGTFLPSLSSEAENLKSWQQVGCPSLSRQLPASALKVFSPFLTKVCDPQLQVMSFDEIKKRDYLGDWLGARHFLSVFMAGSPQEEDLIRSKFPEGHALVESLKQFSHAMEHDLRWMIPIAFLLATLILVFYYRNLIYIVSVYIPFLTGLGLFFIAQKILHQNIDLISALGLLMVFGFSLDYGVFIVDITAFPQANDSKPVVHSALGVAALGNIVGFLPLLFAKHPMLLQLGTALFFGTVGTYVGAIWGVGPGLEFFRRRFGRG